MSVDCRLYLISPPALDDLSAFHDALGAALDAGDIACVQLRLKGREGEPVADDMVLRAGERLLPLTTDTDTEFLINDRPDLALQLGADGVHLGQDDTSYDHARKILGDELTIGVTCHNSKHLALIAGEAGADYVAFGAFFDTATKQAPTRADPALLEWWRFATTVPSVAIGGITPENCAGLARAGADFLAVSAAIWGHRDGPAAGVRAFEAAIREG